MTRLFLAFLLLFAFNVCKAQEGIWSGELNIQGTKLPLVFHFEKEKCSFDSPAQGAKGLKAIKSYTPEGKIRVELPTIGAAFEGYMAFKIITGTFFQGGISLPLTLKPGDSKPNRPQTPTPPFPYTTEDIVFYNDNFTFKGTLTLPEGYTNCTPVLVMVTGSGLQNRDEEIMGHRPFAVIADALARQGIATMRYDDRGYEDTTFSFFDYTISDYASDAEAGIQLMRERFSRVGVIGHSEGGTIAFILASEGKIDFCVSLAGMAVSGKETLLDQNRVILSSMGLEVSDVDTYCEALDKVCSDLASNNTANAVTETKVPAILKDNYKAAIEQLSTRYMRDFLKQDISKDLQRINCPVLALNGKNDTQINAERNLTIIDKSLTNSKHEVVAFERLNHIFQHCETGLPNEYQAIEETIASEVIVKIVEWIKSL